MHERLSLELQQGGVMEMTIRVAMQRSAIGMLMVGLPTPGILIAAMSVGHCREIARRCPGMLN